jgi:hypothetical protein
MMDTKATPDVSSLCVEDNGTYVEINKYAYGQYVGCVASVWRHVNPDAKRMANLFAAAPDLLEACEDTLALFDVGGQPSTWSYDDFKHEVDSLRAAIARARGRA